MGPSPLRGLSGINSMSAIFLCALFHCVILDFSPRDE